MIDTEIKLTENNVYDALNRAAEKNDVAVRDVTLDMFEKELSEHEAKEFVKTKHREIEELFEELKSDDAKEMFEKYQGDLDVEKSNELISKSMEQINAKQWFLTHEAEWKLNGKVQKIVVSRTFKKVELLIDRNIILMDLLRQLNAPVDALHVVQVEANTDQLIVELR